MDLYIDIVVLKINHMVFGLLKQVQEFPYVFNQLIEHSGSLGAA